VVNGNAISLYEARRSPALFCFILPEVYSPPQIEYSRSIGALSPVKIVSSTEGVPSGGTEGFLPIQIVMRCT